MNINLWDEEMDRLFKGRGDKRKEWDLLNVIKKGHYDDDQQTTNSE